MGCGTSRLGEHGMVHPVKARPLLFLRFEESRKRRHLIEAFSSKKHSSAKPDGKDQSSVLTDDTGSCITSEGSKGGSPVKAKEEVKLDNEGGIIDTLAKDYYMHGTEEEVNDGDAKIEGRGGDQEEEDEGRMIGRRGGDDVYSGSPSFRIYYTGEMGDNKIEDVDDDEILTGKAPIEKDDPKPLKVEVEVPVPLSEEAKKRNKRRSFKNVLPTSRQAKNLFNVRAIYMSRSQSNPDRAHLLAAKAHS